MVSFTICVVRVVGFVEKGVSVISGSLLTSVICGILIVVSCVVIGFVCRTCVGSVILSVLKDDTSSVMFAISVEISMAAVVCEADVEVSTLVLSKSLVGDVTGVNDVCLSVDSSFSVKIVTILEVRLSVVVFIDSVVVISSSIVLGNTVCVSFV